MEVSKHLRTMVDNIRLEDPKNSIHHAQTNTDIAEGQTIRSEMARIVKAVLLTSKPKMGMLC